MILRRLVRVVTLPLLVLFSGKAQAEPHVLKVDFGTQAGEIRALHGINKGPLHANGLLDVIEGQKRLKIPFTRLHDCHHPNPEVVDVHTIFRNPGADPSKPEGYDFRATDEYIAAVRATGAEVIYRLGESIEHGTVKRHVHPPGDVAKWAELCAGIVRHYNEGWAGGHRYGIRYWEIWNEPENRPVMWTGNDAQFLELYKTTALRLRREFPSIKIGGPAFGYCGKYDGTKLEPSELCNAFLDLCRKDAVPLDFFSWHCYTDQPMELAARAKAVRALLNARGFSKTESHLNEWNYLPDNKWDIVSRTVAPPVRQQAFEQMTGAPGAAFLAASLIELQDAPVDVANFFHGECGLFGIFTEVGAPLRAAHAMEAFAQMLETRARAKCEGGLPGKLSVLAGLNPDKTKAAILVANLSGPEEVRISVAGLPWAEDSLLEVRTVDVHHALERTGGSLTFRLAPPAVALVSLRAKQ